MVEDSESPDMMARRTRLIVVVTLAATALAVAVVGWHLGGPAAFRSITGGAADRAGGDLKRSEPRPSAADPNALPGSDAASGGDSSGPCNEVIQHLAAELQAIAAESEGLRRDTMLATLIAGLPTCELRGALEFIEAQSTSELNDDARLQLLQRWVSDHPWTAAEWAVGRPAGPGRQEAINSVAITWANQDLEGAANWARELPGADERREAMVKVAYEAVRSDPLAALQLAVELPANAARNDLIRHSAADWAANDPQAAVGWAKQVREPVLRDQVLSSVATAWGETDPVAAATLTLESISAGRQQDVALVSIVQRWVQQKPEAAAAWVAQFPAGGLRDVAVRELVSLWAGQDAQQAGNWVNQMGDASSRDSAVAAYANAIVLKSPEAAAAWAVTIADESLRGRELGRVTQFWLASDATSARGWIAHSSLSAEQKQILLGPQSE